MELQDITLCQNRGVLGIAGAARPPHKRAITSIPKVAIACQGGGSHAAFAAGVLTRLLGPELRGRFQVVALSGTSGGAMCASLAWRGLVASGPDEAVQRLLRFWRDLEVHDLVDAIGNFWAVSLARWPVTLEVSPYLYDPPAEPRLMELLRAHLDLDQLPRDRERRSRPRLLVGATDVLTGDRVIFPGETLTYDDLIASAAVPPLFRAVHADGHLYWDGLFATNPPVREFTDLEDRPDEIWVVQINPQHREGEPRSMREIVDRRNELAGNLSLGQELYFVDRINQLIDRHEGLVARYKRIRLRIVELEAEGLDYPSKLDRRSSFIEHLVESGRERAEWFFDARSEWPRARTAPARSVLVHHGAAHS
jgi:NTE family protein